MDKPDTSYLFDAKMELHPEEESFAQPTIILKNKGENRCNVVRVTAVVVIIGVVAAAFIGGYMVRRTVSKCKKEGSGDVPSSPAPPQVRLQEILEEMSAEQIEGNLRKLTLQPHHASSKRNDELADWIKDEWESLGFEVKLIRYNVLLSFPVKGKINGAKLYDGSGKVQFQTAEKEKVMEPSEESPDALPPFSGYSPTGKEKGDLMYVNYGRREDFELLSSRNISCFGKIVIARYGRVFRGDKVTNAQNCGAKAILIYNDPTDFAPVSDEDLFPHGWWLPRSGVQRGSILIGTGDPLTPRYPSKDGIYRKSSDEIKMPHIPAHPISAEDAERFLRLLGGDEAPDDWQGGLHITYRLGPGFSSNYSDWKVEVETNNDHTKKNITNVIAILKGSLEPDRLILLGNHRDAWVFGGIDPSSGTACLMEIARALGSKYKQGSASEQNLFVSINREANVVYGDVIHAPVAVFQKIIRWRPRRSIVLCSWGGEEYGLLGSTEWVEDNVHLLYQRAVAYLNVDSPMRGNYSLFVRASPLLHQALFTATKQVKNPIDIKQSVYENWLDKFPAADGLNPKVPPLGSGSDYSPFCQRAGVPSADIRYVFDMYQFHNISAYPAYHTIHDTFYYVKTFVDPQFSTHLAIARVWVSTAFLLAETPVLPINCSDYAAALKKGFRDINTKYGKTLEQKRISLEYLEKAVKEFEKGAEKMQSLISNVDLNNPWKLSFINDRLTGLEKNFLNPEGLPGRPLYWHSIFAPSLYNSYASATFPGLHDALVEAVNNGLHNGTWSVVKEELSDTIVAIEWAAQFLKSEV